MLRARHIPLITLVLLATSLPACGTAGLRTAREVTKLENEMSVLRKAITKQIGDPVADDPSQCGVLPAGSAACGGPAGYVVYSKRVTEQKVLGPLLEREAQLQRRMHQINQAVGACMVVPLPEVVIENGRCQASPSRDMIIITR
jgi:hypothetical protein